MNTGLSQEMKQQMVDAKKHIANLKQQLIELEKVSQIKKAREIEAKSNITDETKKMMLARAMSNIKQEISILKLDKQPKRIEKISKFV